MEVSRPRGCLNPLVVSLTGEVDACRLEVCPNGDIILLLPLAPNPNEAEMSPAQHGSSLAIPTDDARFCHQAYMMLFESSCCVVGFRF